MTEYKMGLFSFVNHIPVLIIESAFVVAAIYINYYVVIFISVTGAVLLVTIIAIIVNSYKVYIISDDLIQIRFGKKITNEYKLSDIKTVKDRKRNMEIGIYSDGKVKTIYIGWYISKYKKMKNQLIENIKKLDNFDRIIFVDRW